MIQIVDKEKCCGCAACQLRCPTHCIHMVADNEGFLYPVVDEKKCVDCGLCEKVCQMLKPYDDKEPKASFAAYSLNDTIRSQSSSGGVFFELVKLVIKEKKGVVFGARFDEAWQVKIDDAETIEEAKLFMGSKYVQANVGDSYQKAGKFLKAGRFVLYSGTPCQISGLHHFLRVSYDNLLTVDVSCHGVPSPKVWNLYLTEICGCINKINGISFRSKKEGWKNFHFQLSFESKTGRFFTSSRHWDNPFMKAFLCDLILRPSCSECRAKHGSSNSDLTIADFWGIEKEKASFDDDKGTSLVLVNTEKGQQIISRIEIRKENVDYMRAIEFNNGLKKNSQHHPKRALFFEKIDCAESICRLIEETLRPTIYGLLKNKVKNAIRLILKSGGGKLR